ncbi:MAG: von Willebrand factor type A domain-containing protein [Flavobacteriales bacterium]
MRCILITVMALLLSAVSMAQSTGSLKVVVTDQNCEPIPFANVILLQNKKIITGNQTDFDGRAELKGIQPGQYLLELSSLGFSTVSIKDVKIDSNKCTVVPKEQTVMAISTQELACVEVVYYSKPLFEKGGGNTETVMTSRGSHSMAARNPAQLAATAGGTYSPDAASIRGSRTDANYYYIDGIKVRGSSTIPNASADQVTVLTGGLPARYENPEAAAQKIQIAHGHYYGVSIFEAASDHRESKKQRKATIAERHVYDKLLDDYEYYTENDFKSSASEELSTFSIDVDKGSYTNARRIINSGYLPPLASVRMEEFINYFPYERMNRDDEHPFIVDTELGACPWNANHHLLKVTLQADELDLSEAASSNLVFLLDVSGSMGSADKLPLIKRSFLLLTDQLRDEDRVSIVVYAGSSGIVLDGAKGSEKQKIRRAIDQLYAGGSTAGGEGILLAYKTAEKHFIKKGNNRVILATDGDFNVGVTSDDALVELIEEKRESGVFLTTIGCGTGNYHDAKLEKLADHGNGSYAYIDTYKEARKVFLKELTGTLYTVAKDVKFQIEFNPNKVASYRLLGYENRVLEDKDFDDDLKDAGELGAGQMVTAFYEIVPTGAEPDTLDVIEKRYKETVLASAADSDEWLNLKVRYKLPDKNESTLIERPVTLKLNSEEELSESFRFGSSVVEVALILRHSRFMGTADLANAIERAKGANTFDPEGHRREFIALSEMCEEMYASVD